MEDLKFTKEIKQAWLDALKSGKYIQGKGELMSKYDGIVKHCCLGVLCEIHPRLSLHLEDSGRYAITEELDGKFDNEGDWTHIKKLLPIDSDDFFSLYNTNDELCDGKYTAVIPLIENIPTDDN